MIRPRWFSCSEKSSTLASPLFRTKFRTPQVSANRVGYGHFTAYRLKIIQEAITLAVFVIFAFLYLGEDPNWNYLASFLCIMAAGFSPLARASSHSGPVRL